MRRQATAPPAGQVTERAMERPNEEASKGAADEL